MRPGSVTTVAEVEGKLLFGLSGNPSACYVGCELYVRPVIGKYLHREDSHIYRAEAIYKKTFRKQTHLLFCKRRVEIVDGNYKLHQLV